MYTVLAMYFSTERRPVRISTVAILLGLRAIYSSFGLGWARACSGSSRTWAR
jgi:hypothetical protein